MENRPSYPDYAVKDLFELNVGVPKGSKEWRAPGHITSQQAIHLRDDIAAFLKRFSDLSDSSKQISRHYESQRVATLFIGDKEQDFLKSEAFMSLRKSVMDFGVLFIDTEFTDGETLKKFGCQQQVSSGTIDLIQLGGISGHAALLQVRYDCREIHGCVCDKNCLVGKCKLNDLRHKPWESQHLFKNYGVPVPEEIITWLKDDSILKVQSGIVNTDGSYGDIERLELLLGVKIKGFVELQNLTVAWFPQRDTVCRQQGCEKKDFKHLPLLDQHVDDVHGGNVQKRSGNSFLAEMLDVVRADVHYKKVMKKPIWRVDRRKPYSRWPAALKFYDLSDVLVPAMFLLQVGVDVVMKERATCSATNIIPYLRQVLLLYKNEPSLVIHRKESPPGKYFPFRDWSGYGCEDIHLSEAGAFPWRPGMNLPSGIKIDGQIISRNLRQLASELTADVYRLGLGFEDLAEEYRPPSRLADRLWVAKRNWRSQPFCEAPPCNSGRSLQRGRFQYIQHRADTRKRRAQEIPRESKRPRTTPNHKMTRPVYYGHCFRCGAADHTKENCREDLRCLYPLCTNPQRRHDVRVCDALHTICGLCRFRGHNHDDHKKFDLVSLLKISNAWAPAGLFTSLPVLSADPAFWRQPTNEEMAYDSFNQVGRFKYFEKNN